MKQITQIPRDNIMFKIYIYPQFIMHKISTIGENKAQEKKNDTVS